MEFAGILREKKAEGDWSTLWEAEDVSGTYEVSLPNYESISEGDIIFLKEFEDGEKKYTNALPDCRECETDMLQTGDRIICPHCNNTEEFLW